MRLSTKRWAATEPGERDRLGIEFLNRLDTFAREGNPCRNNDRDRGDRLLRQERTNRTAIPVGRGTALGMTGIARVLRANFCRRRRFFRIHHRGFARAVASAITVIFRGFYVRTGIERIPIMAATSDPGFFATTIFTATIVMSVKKTRCEHYRRVEPGDKQLQRSTIKKHGTTITWFLWGVNMP